MFGEKKLSKYIVTSTLFHMLIALAISGIYAQQPQRPSGLRIVSAIRIAEEELKLPPKPKPKVVTKSEPLKKAEPKKVEPKPKTQKVEPPKVTQRTRDMRAPAPGLAMEQAPDRSRAAPGAAGLIGKRGEPGDRPGMRASGGINFPELTTTTGGAGLKPGITHGSMKVPAGTGQLPGAGGKDAAGFKMGYSRTGTGVGRVDIAGRGGSGGTRGQGDEGPGAGLSATGRIDARGGGQAETGLGVGSTGGMGEVDSGGGGRGPGGGGGGPGSGGYDTVEARKGPSVTADRGVEAKDKELPEKKDIPEDKRSGATGKKEFKADVKRDMAGVAQKIEEPVSSEFDDELRAEIEKHMLTLRKMHEDWNHRKIPNVPRVLQITLELDTEKGKPKLLKADFHNSALSTIIRDALIEKIKTWKFESLYDGKDDPKKWPIKLSGKISWQ